MLALSHVSKHLSLTPASWEEPLFRRRPSFIYHGHYGNGAPDEGRMGRDHPEEPPSRPAESSFLGRGCPWPAAALAALAQANTKLSGGRGSRARAERCQRPRFAGARESWPLSKDLENTFDYGILKLCEVWVFSSLQWIIPFFFLLRLCLQLRWRKKDWDRRAWGRRWFSAVKPPGNHVIFKPSGHVVSGFETDYLSVPLSFWNMGIVLAL